MCVINPHARRVARPSVAVPEESTQTLAPREHEAQTCCGAAASSDIIFCDEPMIGRDVTMRTNIRRFAASSFDLRCYFFQVYRHKW